MQTYWYRFSALTRVAALALALVALSPTVAPAAALASPAASPARQDRPELPGDLSAGSEHFLVHYTTDGHHGVSERDSDGNGTPDYVDDVLQSLEESWQTEVVTMGWAAPPNDDGTGGDERIDVYLEDDLSDDIAGYTSSSDGMIGDNPNSPEREDSAAFSYMSIDNDFEDVDLPDGETSKGLMQATIAHEFAHVIQAGYDSSDLQTWLYEATAVWMETQVYPDVSDNLLYLPDLLDHPEGCIANRKLWYGSWLFVQYIAEQYGEDTIRAIWEHSRGLDGYAAIDEALSPYGSSLVAASTDFAVANLLRAYEDGLSYPAVHLDGELKGEGTYAPDKQVQTLGASYVRLASDGAVTITFAGSDSLSGRVVGVLGDQAEVFEFDSGKVQLDMGHYQEVYLIVHNDNVPEPEARCFGSDYAVTVENGGDASTEVAATWPANGFEPLSSTASSSGVTPNNVHQPYRGNNSSAKSPDDLETDFDTIVPPAPDGYYFDYAYLMTKRDFGTSAPFYIPDSEESANYDFLNKDGDSLSVSESPTSLESLQDWTYAIQYQPSEDTVSIHGVDVLIEETGSNKHDELAATFIYTRLFIVVEGDGSRQDLETMVESIIAKKAGITPDTGGGTQGPAPSLETPEPSQANSPADDNATSVAILSVVTLCGIGVCMAGVMVFMVVMVLRRRK